MANALLLTETMAPEAYRAAREAMEALGVEDQIELFQSSGHGTDTARLVLYGQPVGVEFLGGHLERLDHSGLLAVLGHEIGHALAHSGHPIFGWALQACAGGRTPARRAYAMAAELTADRFGLLACRDLDAVLRLEMQMSAGPSARSIRFDTEAYLEQCRAVGQEIVAGGGAALGSSHPEHYVRGYAEWLFSETDVYRSITGKGPGTRSIEEVDAIVAKLLGASATTKAPASSEEEALAPDADEPDSKMAAKSAPAEVRRERVVLDALPAVARRKLEAARDALASLTGARPTPRSDAPRAEQPADDDSADPLEDERRELIARFEELERRAKGDH